MNIKNILEFDRQASTRLRLPRTSGPLFTLAAVLAHSGDSWFWLAGLGLVWLFSSAVWHRWAAIFIVSIVLLAILVLAIKFTIRRRRPEGDWGAVYRNTDPHSFPSGHAARAAMLAALGLALGPAWFGVVLLFWAPLVSLARVVVGVHYLSDVAAGLVIGVMAGAVMAAVHPALIQAFPFIF